jgi:hypothetical protein
MRMRRPSLTILAGASALLLMLCGVASAQTPAGVAPKTVVGSWELSNAERDRSCTLSLKSNVSTQGFGLDWARECAELFPFTREVAAWKIGARDALQLLDGSGRVVIELTEVEGGLYEGERPGQGLVFLQSIAASGAEERKAEQVVGDWAFVRAGGRAICRITLSAKAAAQDALALSVKPGCDSLITRFGPVAWRLDRGQLVLIPAKGNSWRFEEVDSTTWNRIPEGRQPIQLVRQ